MSKGYVPPKTLKMWLVDELESEKYELSIFDNGSVCIASGRFAHSSGASLCTWSEFLAGKIDDMVVKTIGAVALEEAKIYLARLSL